MGSGGDANAGESVHGGVAEGHGPVEGICVGWRCADGGVGGGRGW